MQSEQKREQARPMYPVPIHDARADERPAEVVRFGGCLFARSWSGPWRLLVQPEDAGVRETDD